MAAPRAQLINKANDDAQAEAYISTLMPWHVKHMHKPTTLALHLGGDPRCPGLLYIHTTNDKIISLASQKLMLDQFEDRGIRDALPVTLDSDLEPFVFPIHLMCAGYSMILTRLDIYITAFKKVGRSTMCPCSWLLLTLSHT